MCLYYFHIADIFFTFFPHFFLCNGKGRIDECLKDIGFAPFLITFPFVTELFFFVEVIGYTIRQVAILFIIFLTNLPLFRKFAKKKIVPTNLCFFFFFIKQCSIFI